LLIVDADPESRNAMRHLLVSAGCRVIEADSGGQAAVQISGQVAVVIARLRSGLPGLDALRELQALHEDVQTLVLADAEAARRWPDLLRERRVECVFLPWRQDELLARLRLAVRIWTLSCENRALRRTACASHPGVANTQDRGCDASGVEDVREPTTASRRESDSDIGLAGMTLAEIERRAIRETLRACAGHRGKAARSLGVSEKTIYNKIKSYQIRGVH
jgi:DNA-binding NtrC family response regulator